MTEPLALLIWGVSLLGLFGVVVWRPRRQLACLTQVVLLSVLVGLDLIASQAVVTVALVLGGMVLLGRYRLENRLTTSATLLAGVVMLIVALVYPPEWTLAFAFIFGWANFVGTLSSDSRANGRDATDLAPAALVILLGAGLVASMPETAAIVVFSALAFIANDVLASELGPEFNSPARLPPGFAIVPHGTLGAVSLAGTASGIFGSLVAASCAGLLTASTSVTVAALIGGLTGSLADSALIRNGFLRHGVRRGREVVNSAACLAAITSGFVIAWMLS